MAITVRYYISSNLLVALIPLKKISQLGIIILKRFAKKKKLQTSSNHHVRHQSRLSRQPQRQVICSWLPLRNRQR